MPVPAVGGISPHSMRIVVVLPEPFGPSSPNTSPRSHLQGQGRQPRSGRPRTFRSPVGPDRRRVAAHGATSSNRTVIGRPGWSVRVVSLKATFTPISRSARSRSVRAIRGVNSARSLIATMRPVTGRSGAPSSAPRTRPPVRSRRRERRRDEHPRPGMARVADGEARLTRLKHLARLRHSRSEHDAVARGREHELGGHRFAATECCPRRGQVSFRRPDLLRAGALAQPAHRFGGGGLPGRRDSRRGDGRVERLAAGDGGIRERSDPRPEAQPPPSPPRPAPPPARLRPRGCRWHAPPPADRATPLLRPIRARHVPRRRPGSWPA